MNKPTKTALAPYGRIVPPNITTDQLKQTIVDAVASVGSDGKGTGGLLGYLDKIGRENPELAERMRGYARYFATPGVLDGLKTSVEGLKTSAEASHG